MKKLGCIWLMLFIVVSFFYCENAGAVTNVFEKDFQEKTADKVEISAQNWKYHFIAEKQEGGLWDITEEIGDNQYIRKNAILEKYIGKLVFIYENEIQIMRFTIKGKYLIIENNSKNGKF